MASHWEFLASLPFRKYCTAVGWSNYILLSTPPMAYENMGERERVMCALEVLYSCEKHSIIFFSIPEWLDFKGQKHS